MDGRLRLVDGGFRLGAVDIGLVQPIGVGLILLLWQFNWPPSGNP